MNKTDIQLGGDYALRETAGAKFERVQVLEHIRRDKWRVEWRDKNPGLVDYVRSTSIICPPGERTRVARDERRAREMREEADRTWPGAEHPLALAVDEVLEATGDDCSVHRGVLSGPPDAIERVAARGHYEPPAGSGYLDRHGIQHLPWIVALDLAKAFSVAEPSTVLLHVDVGERRWEIEAREPGGAYMLGLLEDYRAAWAIIRQWSSFDEERSRLDEEIQRLRQLITRTVWELRMSDTDPERVASRLDRALRSG